VQRVGAEIGAEYVLEGSVRRAGETVRVTAQLIDTGSGSHLWADTYDRAVDPANLFEVQDDIAAKVAAMVAASYGGAISATGLRSASGRPPERLSSYECVLETFGIWRGQSAELVERSRDCLVVAVERDPGYADAWAMLSLVYQYQRWYGWGLQPPESHDLDQRAYLARKAVEAAQKAVKLAPDSATANYSLACAYWAAGDTEKFRIQTERALSLNPHDPSFLGALGNYVAYAGWWDEGVAMVEKAVALAPTSYATWWLWAIAKDHFRKGEYVRALAGFERAFIPGFWLSQLQLAYTHGMLGNTKQAAQAVARLQELMPGFSTSEALAYYRMWNFEPSYLDRMAEGLRRAGLPQDPHRISG
jgi:adenylate cyclase